MKKIVVTCFLFSLLTVWCGATVAVGEEVADGDNTMVEDQMEEDCDPELIQGHTQGSGAKDYISEEEVREIVQKKAPNAQLMGMVLDYNHAELYYLGRMFQDASPKSRSTGRYETKTKIEFQVNPRSGKVVSWQVFQFHFLIPENPVPVMSKEEAKTILLTKVPNATVYQLEWDMNKDLVFYTGCLQKEGMEYDYVLDAYTGHLVAWKEHPIDSTTSAELPEETNVIAEGPKYLTKHDVQEIVRQRVPGARIVALDRYSDEKGAWYEGRMIKSKKWYTFSVDAISGEIIDWDSFEYKGPPVRSYHTSNVGPSLPVIPTAPIVTMPKIPTPPRPLKVPDVPALRGERN
ncbi:MAG: PepSY domain-containing protein [Planctomycetia bacterium]|nr:PepSY domain-containing protein [Planctomycetia bacterium]